MFIIHLKHVKVCKNPQPASKISAVLPSVPPSLFLIMFFFFRNLLPKLLSLPEELVGRRLVPLLLSRFVILDQTACQFVLPHILTPCLGTVKIGKNRTPKAV